MAKTPAKGAARPPENTQGAEDRLEGVQAPEQAEALQAVPAAGAAGAGGGPTPPATDPGPMVTVTGPRAGRWRRGRHFGPVPVAIRMADLSAGDVEALTADPALRVELPPEAGP